MSIPHAREVDPAAEAARIGRLRRAEAQLIVDSTFQAGETADGAPNFVRIWVTADEVTRPVPEGLDRTIMNVLRVHWLVGEDG